MLLYIVTAALTFIHFRICFEEQQFIVYTFLQRISVTLESKVTVHDEAQIFVFKHSILNAYVMFNPPYSNDQITALFSVILVMGDLRIALPYLNP